MRLRTLLALMGALLALGLVTACGGDDDDGDGGGGNADSGGGGGGTIKVGFLSD